MTASFYGHEKIVCYLADMGANLNLRSQVLHFLIIIYYRF